MAFRPLRSRGPATAECKNRKRRKKSGPTEIRTRITGFRVLGANHYTMGPTGFLMQQDPADLFTKSHSLFFFLFFLKTKLKTLVKSVAVVAEWLRRLTRNQLRSPCTGSNPVNCAFFFARSCRFFSRIFLISSNQKEVHPRWDSNPQSLA